MKQESNLLSERVTLRSWLCAIGGIAIGLLLIYLSNIESISLHHSKWSVFLVNVGSVVFASCSIIIVWNLAGKRAFLDEILAKANLSADVKSSGVLQITDSFHNDIKWSELIKGSTEIDIFFAYGETWRNTHKQDFENALKEKDFRLRVVLPDPSNEETMRELARRFDYSESELRDKVKRATDFFYKELNCLDDKQVMLWYLPNSPVLSFYRFANKGVLSTYKHRKGRGGVPTFVCEQGGMLFNFIKAEFNAMISETDSLAKPVRRDQVE